MRFIKLFRHDLRSGLLREYKKWIAAWLLFLGLCTDFALRQSGRMALVHADGASVSDYLFYVFEGIKPLGADDIQRIPFPAAWLLVMLFAQFLVLDYPCADLTGCGQQVLIRAKSRTDWWLSKCCWVTGSLCMYFLLLWGTAALFALVTGTPLSASVSPYMLDQQAKAGAGEGLGWLLMGMPLVVSVALGLVQLLLSLLIRPLYSFCVSVAVLGISAYTLHPALIGNYAMTQRSERLIADGVDAATGLIICAALGVVAVIGGAVVFRRYDIINKEE